MLVNETLFREKLDKLNASQNSVDATSAWCQMHREDARLVADVWEDYFSKADQGKRLAMVYLANDIIQNARKKGPEFAMEFFRVLPRALRHMMGKADEPTRTRVNKVIRVWDERKVFGTSGAKTFHQLVHDLPGTAGTPGAAAPSRATAAAAQLPLPVAAMAAPGHPAAAQLGEAMAAADGAAARSRQLSGAVSVAVPQVLGAGSAANVQQVSAARQAVQGLLSALQAELGSRQAAASQLRQLLDQQEAGVAAAAAQLEACSQQLMQLDARLAEVQAAAAAPPAWAAQQEAAAAAPPQPWAAAAPQAVAPAAPPLPPEPAYAAVEPVDAASEAASLAAALAQNQNSAQALMAALMSLPQDQQEGLGADLAGLLKQQQPGQAANGGAGSGGTGVAMGAGGAGAATGGDEGGDDIFGADPELYDPDEM